jgi:hypothetical protein
MRSIKVKNFEAIEGPRQSYLLFSPLWSAIAHAQNANGHFCREKSHEMFMHGYGYYGLQFQIVQVSSGWFSNLGHVDDIILYNFLL